MPIIKKFTKFGSSLALLIDRSILELLDMKYDVPVQLELGEDGKSLIIRSISLEEQKRRQFKDALKEINRNHLP